MLMPDARDILQQSLDALCKEVRFARVTIGEIENCLRPAWMRIDDDPIVITYRGPVLELGAKRGEQIEAIIKQAVRAEDRHIIAGVDIGEDWVEFPHSIVSGTVGY